MIFRYVIKLWWEKPQMSLFLDIVIVLIFGNVLTGNQIPIRFDVSEASLKAV